MGQRSQHSKEATDDRKRSKELRDLRVENKALKRRVASLQREIEKLVSSYETVNDGDPALLAGEMPVKKKEEANLFPHHCGGKPDVVEILTAYKILHVCKTCQARRALNREDAK